MVKVIHSPSPLSAMNPPAAPVSKFVRSTSANSDICNARASSTDAAGSGSGGRSNSTFVPSSDSSIGSSKSIFSSYKSLTKTKSKNTFSSVPASYGSHRRSRSSGRRRANSGGSAGSGDGSGSGSGELTLSRKLESMLSPTHGHDKSFEWDLVLDPLKPKQVAKVSDDIIAAAIRPILGSSQTDRMKFEPVSERATNQSLCDSPKRAEERESNNEEEMDMPMPMSDSGRGRDGGSIAEESVGRHSPVPRLREKSESVSW